MTMRIIRKITYLAVTLLLAGCIKNDIPYATIQAAFLSMVVDHQSSDATIDTHNQVVTLNLDEQADIQNVKVISYMITEGATSSEDLTMINLSSPKSVTLSLYQDYKWTIKANQTIERYFAIKNQVGAAVVDPPAKRVVAYVPKGTDLTKITVDSIKLGPAEITTMTPDLNGQTADFSQPKEVTVKYHDYTEVWTIYIQQTDVAVSLTAANPGTRVIWVYGEGQTGKNNGFQYRKVGDSDWITLASSSVTVTGGTFSAVINNVSPNTEYEVRAYSDDAYSAVTTVKTGTEWTIPNGNFETWFQDGKVWCPWTSGSTAFWGTGNKGATTLGNSNTYPSTDTWNGKSGYSAELDTKFVGLGVVGKLAAGNIFSGDYVRTDGTNGVLNFGRAFNGRPTKLTGHFKYKCVNITNTSTEYASFKGRPDTASIYIALTDWSSQFEIRTNPSNRQLFDKNSSHVIAYGELIVGHTVSNWTDFTITLNYRSTSVTPTYILIVASASKYGDYFTGGDGSVLMIDDFSLDWKY
jgi:hypothetical protein